MNINNHLPLIVSFESPVSGVVSLDNSLWISGWILVEDQFDLTELRRSLSISCVLEEEGNRDLGLGSNLLLSGELLKNSSEDPVSLEERVYLEEIVFDWQKLETVNHPDLGRAGRALRFRGSINLTRVRSANQEVTKSYYLTLIVQNKFKCAISNPIKVIVEPSGSRNIPRGGFIDLAEGEFNSDFLLIEGWALLDNEELVQVDLFLNDYYLGNAQINIPSSKHYSFFPDLAFSRNCRFAKVVRYSELSSSGFPALELAKPLVCKALVKFKSGASFEFSAPGVLWNLAWQKGHWPPEICGEIESAYLSSKGLLRVEGWLFNPSPLGEAVWFETPRFLLPLNSDSDQPTLFFKERPDIEQRFAPYIGSRPLGFTIEVIPDAFGNVPGFLAMHVADHLTGRCIKIGPQSMWKVINELVISASSKSSAMCNASSLVSLASFFSKRRAAQEIVRSKADSRRPHSLKRIVFVSHNLSAVEGAPKVLFQVADYIVKEKKAEVEVLVISPLDGPLGDKFRELGVQVIIVPYFAHSYREVRSYRQGIAALSRILNEFSPDLIYVNSLESSWAVDCAFGLQIPSVWAIHESVDPVSLIAEWAPKFKLALLHHLQGNKRTIFVSENTARLFRPYLPEGSEVIIPNSVNLDCIESLRSQWNKFDARASLGIAQDCKVISIVGTTTERKGQDVFLREMALLKSRRSDYSFVFLIVGARDIPFLDYLRGLVKELDLLEQAVFVPETPDISQYFVASDVLVISSREESAPLVSLEAFAYGVPLVSTTVFGLAEQICDQENALAFDINRVGELAIKVEMILSDPVLAAKLVAGGQKSIKDKFCEEKNLKKYWEVISSIQLPSSV